MKTQGPHYYTGGIAQIVDHPTPLTYSFLSHWFSGAQSYGRAMKLLKLPYTTSTGSAVVMHRGELVCDLWADEEILYKETVFSYRPQSDSEQSPTLFVDFHKCFSPMCIANTLKSIWVQSMWIANPSAIVTRLQTTVSQIDTTRKKNINTLDTHLTEAVLPAVIAVGYVSEYIHQYLMHEVKDKAVDVNRYIASRVAQTDWIFQSLTDQYKVKTHELSFDAYMDRYGVRADRDLELDCPRWSEIPTDIQKRIDQSIEPKTPDSVICPPTTLMPLIDASIALQILRTKVKHTMLYSIQELRDLIRAQTPDQSSLSHLTREQILRGEFPPAPETTKVHVPQTDEQPAPTSGRGTPVSVGDVKGTVRQIHDPTMPIPEGTIGVFPNASPEFSIQFPKCVGLIFARGGQTSHGAIVAREFGIPAIIERSALTIPDGSTITILGTDGTWQLQ